MSFIADAHRQWHSQFPDAPWDCPLDCGMAEQMEWDEEDEQDGNVAVPVPEAPAPIIDPWTGELDDDYPF